MCIVTVFPEREQVYFGETEGGILTEIDDDTYNTLNEGSFADAMKIVKDLVDKTCNLK